MRLPCPEAGSRINDGQDKKYNTQDQELPVFRGFDRIRAVEKQNNNRKGTVHMKIVVLDGYTENPGDLSWGPLEKFGELTVYDRTAYEESPLIAERIGDAEIVIMNKTPISKETLDKCPNVKLIAVLAQCSRL